MNPTLGDHPDDETLAAWAAGTLSADDLELVDQHVEACDRCATRLEAIDLPVDPLVEKIQQVDKICRESDVMLAEPEDTDENLRLGVLALQSGMIDRQQFVEAAMLWSSRPGSRMAEVLLEQKWIEAEDEEQLSLMLRRRMKTKSDPPAVGGNGPVAPPPTKATLSTWPTLNAKHELRQIYSSGGIGRVWLAHDKILHRDVALKELRAEYAKVPAHRERFQREAHVAAQLTHPGTVPVYELFDDGKQCYYTMKFLAGGTLTQLAERMHAQRVHTGQIDFVMLFRYLGYFLQVCDTIAYAHAVGVVHRDLKGENVIVGDFGEVTVIDWGLAKQMNPGATGASTITPSEARQSDTLQGDRLGTPSYMSPEQARGDVDQIDARTDVYGLAAMLYEILTGRPPFEGGSIHETLHKVENEPPLPPSQFYPDVAPALEDICLQGLSKQKEDRQPTAKALHDQLQLWMSHQAQNGQVVKQRGQLFAHCLDPLMIIDSQANITNVNSAWERLMGIAGEQAQQTTLLNLVHPDDRAILHSALAELEHENSIKTPPVRVSTSDGAHVWLAFTLVNLLGEPSIYVICRDETTYHADLRRHQAILEGFPDGIAILNREGKIEVSNRRLDNLFGYETGELIGQSLEALFPVSLHVPLPPLTTYLQSALFRPRDPEMSLRGLRKDGVEVPVDISSSPLAIDGEKYTIVSIRSDSGRSID